MNDLTWVARRNRSRLANSRRHQKKVCSGIDCEWQYIRTEWPLRSNSRKRRRQPRSKFRSNARGMLTPKTRLDVACQDSTPGKNAIGRTFTHATRCVVRMVLMGAHTETPTQSA